MTDPQTPLRVRLGEPGELIAAVPYLLGFHPVDSIALLAVHGKALGLSMRVDLPEEEEDLSDWLEQVLVPTRRDRPTGVAAVVIGGGDPVNGDPPRRRLVDALNTALLGAGVQLVHAAWTTRIATGAPWLCYDDPLCVGTVPDPATSVAAAATVAVGGVTYRSREELAAVLDGDPVEVLLRRRVLLLAVAHESLSPQVMGERLGQLEALRQAARAGDVVLDDEVVVQVASALRDHRVRDACTAWCVGGDDAERLWLALVRATPAPERAEPAALLAMSAYQRGDGALANVALDAAQAAYPGHGLSQLLRTALDSGMPPELLRICLEGGSAYEEAHRSE